jgi:methionyl-tRNA formyltransferase
MRFKNKEKKLAIFFNSTRGLLVYKKISKLFSVDIFIAKKNLNKEILIFLKKKKINFTLLKRIDTSLVKKIKNKNYDLLVSAGFPLIFNEELINSSKFGTINLHAGKLPNYRGGSPLNWQIINGEKKIGISIVKMCKELDAGDIYSSKIFRLTKKDNIKTVHNKANLFFSKMTIDVINKIYSGIQPVPQKKIGTKTYRQRSENDGLIDWEKLNAKEVFNFVRAITKPYPGAFYFNKNNKKIKIYNCIISKRNPRISAGKVFFANKQKFIKCKNFSIRLKS